ncbi:MAG: DNA-formamidopyrimidine glycosylase [Candidatus Omnitrophota bacterium]|jgi:formamidopyrimidine-DNA glycosylase
MPELPEVETVCRDLQKKILGVSVDHVRIYDGRVVRIPSPEDFVKRLRAKTVAAVSRRGKALIIQLHPGGDFLVVQMMMTGQMIVCSGPQKGRYTKVVFKLSNGKYLHYNDQRLFGRLAVVADLDMIPYFAALGPEPFSRQFSCDYLRQALKNRKAPVKTLLLDAKIVAGIGNIYASEILYDCGLNPCSPSGQLSGRDIEALWTSIRRILKRAVEARGTSVYSYRDAEGRRGGYKDFLKVYGRDNRACYHCGYFIKKIIQGGRSTFFCPTCQR